MSIKEVAEMIAEAMDFKKPLVVSKIVSEGSGNCIPVNKV